MTTRSRRAGRSAAALGGLVLAAVGSVEILGWTRLADGDPRRALDLLPLEARARLAAAKSETDAHGSGVRTALPLVEAGLSRRPRDPWLLIAAAEEAAARGDDAVSDRCLVAAVRVAWNHVPVADAAVSGRVRAARSLALRAARADERAAALERGGKAAEAAEERGVAAAERARGVRLLAVVRTLAAIPHPDAAGRPGFLRRADEATSLANDLGAVR